MWRRMSRVPTLSAFTPFISRSPPLCARSWSRSVCFADAAPSLLRFGEPAIRGMRMTDIVNGLLLRNGTVLLAKRSAGRRAYPNRWSFPGGHVEAGESLHDALIRELREEIGVTPLSFEQIGAIEEPNAQANGDATYHMFAVTAWSGGEPRALGREHSELSWFDLKAAGELRDLAMPDYLPILLRCAVMIDPKAVD